MKGTSPQTAENTDNVTIVKPGLLSFNGMEVQVGVNTNTDNDLLMVANIPGGEALGVLAQREMSGASTIYGAVYRDSLGNSTKVLLDSMGRPDTVLMSDGTMLVFSNYESGSIMAKLSSFSTDGNLIQSEHVTMNNKLFELMSLVNEYGLSIPANVLGKEANSHTTMGKVGGWSLVLKIGGTAISTVTCVIGMSTVITGVGAAIAATGCASATLGFVSTVAYVRGDDTISSTLGNHSMAWGAVACPTGDWTACFTTFIAFVDNFVSGCEVENNHAVQACKDGWVTWFDDCGNSYEPIEECPCGCIDAACIPIEACSTGLTIDVSITASPPCDVSGQYIFFTAQVAGGDTTAPLYTWSFGDGATSVLKEDTHAYEKDGTYIVTLTVNDTRGNYGFASFPVEIGECSEVSAVIAESNTSCAQVNQPVNFSSLVTGGDKDGYTYMWLFGDGAFSPQPNPTHTFTEAGVYSVFLEVTGTDGEKTDVTISQKVGECPTPLAVEITTNVECVDTGESIPFTADVQGAKSADLHYAWDFGDGATNSNQTPTHAYTQMGTYTVEVQIANEQDSTASSSITIKVGDCPDTTTPVHTSGRIVYLTLDTMQKPFVPNMRVMNLDTRQSSEVNLPAGVNAYPIGVSRNGTIVIGAIDHQSGDYSLLISHNWGATTPELLKSTCGDSGYHWSSDDEVSVSEDGIVYFHGTYDSSYYDSTLERTRTLIQHRILAIPTASVGCSSVPIDLDGDGIIDNEFWGDTDLRLGYQSSLLVFAPDISNDGALYSISTSGGTPIELTTQYHTDLQISTDGSRCVFSLMGDNDFRDRASMATTGGSVVNLSEVTGLTLMPEGSFLSHDGTTLVSWTIDMTEGTILMVLIKTDGSSFEYLDTKGVKLCSINPGSYTADGTGIVFIGTKDADISQAAGDIYHIELETGTVTNLTNTPTYHEETIIVR